VFSTKHVCFVKERWEEKREKSKRKYARRGKKGKGEKKKRGRANKKNGGANRSGDYCRDMLYERGLIETTNYLSEEKGMLGRGVEKQKRIRKKK